MTAEEGVELVKKAITAGVMNDLGSGGNVDCVIITKDNSPKHIRPAARPTPRSYKGSWLGLMNALLLQDVP